MKLWIGPEKQRVLTDRLRLIVEKISWTTRVTGVLLSVLSMHFLVVRPLVERVDRLQNELIFVDAALSKAVAENSTILETNDLLSNLKTQHEEVAGARATIRQLQKLRDELVFEAEQFPAAMRAVTRMSELPEHVFQAEADRYSRLVPNPAQSNPLGLRELQVPVRLEEALDLAASSGVRLLNSKAVSATGDLSAKENSERIDNWRVIITER